MASRTAGSPVKHEIEERLNRVVPACVAVLSSASGTKSVCGGLLGMDTSLQVYSNVAAFRCPSVSLSHTHIYIYLSFQFILEMDLQ